MPRRVIIMSRIFFREKIHEWYENGICEPNPDKTQKCIQKRLKPIWLELWYKSTQNKLQKKKKITVSAQSAGAVEYSDSISAKR